MENKGNPDKPQQLSVEDIVGFLAEWDLTEGDLTDQQIAIAIKTGHY